MMWLKLLLVLTLMLLPFGEIFRIELGNSIAVRPLDLAVGLIALVYIANVIRYKKITHTYLNKPLGLFIVASMLSLLVNANTFYLPQLAIAFLYLIRWVAYGLVCLIVIKFDKTFKSLIIKGFFLIGIFVELVGFIQYFLYPNLRNLYYLGWDEHNYRMFSVFLDPNFAGAFFVLFLLFTCGIIHLCIKQKKYNRLIFLSLIISLTVASIILTYSRSAILMWLVGASIYLWLINKKRFILALLGLVGVLVIFQITNSNKENTNLLRVTSSLARVDSYSNSLKIIKDNPIFGVGFNTYRYAQQKYGLRPEKTKYTNHADAGVDNGLLFVTATTGVVGLSAYLYLWLIILKRMNSLRKNKNNIFANVVIASASGLFVNSLFINSLFFTTIMFWMWILIAIAEDY